MQLYGLVMLDRLNVSKRGSINRLTVFVSARSVWTSTDALRTQLAFYTRY